VSQGGGVVLLAIPERSSGRPSPAPKHDFAAAIAFYPGACSETQQSRPLVQADPHSWKTDIPLLVLQGEADNWTPARPCAEFLEGARSRGSPIKLLLYPGAAHAFDMQKVPVHAIEAYRESDFVPVIGTDDAARSDARNQVRDFLAVHLSRAP
jgi:dienelactone hydrolase